nr:hypothetical protein [Tanacetum cinerariifolium]
MVWLTDSPTGAGAIKEMMLLEGKKSVKRQKTIKSSKSARDNPVIDEDKVIPEDETPKLINEFQNVDKRAEEEARYPYLRSLPLKLRPFKNDMKGRVLFIDMYCAKDKGFEMTTPLNDNEVGTEDLLLLCFDLENDCVNDAAKVLEGMSKGNNDASKFVNGINEGTNDGMDDANIDLDEQVLARQKQLNKGKSKMTDEDISQVKLVMKEDLLKLSITIDVDMFGEIDDSGVGLSPLIREHEKFYVKALDDLNEGSTIKVGVAVNPDEKTYFDRFCGCFKALKDGWKMVCRSIIALDVCFLKKPNCDEILIAVGREGNNHIFLVPTGNGLTLMSNQHKGLIEAVNAVMQLAEHRQSTYPQRFTKIMKKIKTANPRAHQHLLAKGPKTRSRDSFTKVNKSHSHEKDEHYENLNGKWSTEACSNIQKILEHSKDQQRFWHVIPHGDNQIEVRRGSDAFKMVEEYVPEYFKKDMYMLTYSSYMKLVDGINFWPDCSHLSRILGPKPMRMPSRPRKKRFKASHETKSNTKISRAGTIIKLALNCVFKFKNSVSLK